MARMWLIETPTPFSTIEEWNDYLDLIECLPADDPDIIRHKRLAKGMRPTLRNWANATQSDR